MAHTKDLAPNAKKHRDVTHTFFGRPRYQNVMALQGKPNRLNALPNAVAVQGQPNMTQHTRTVLKIQTKIFKTGRIDDTHEPTEGTASITHRTPNIR